MPTRPRRMNQPEKQLQEYYQLLGVIAQRREKRESELRFNRVFLTASDIAQQYFCEKKVEMQYRLGRVETEAKALGTEAHEKLVEDTTKIDRKGLWHKIYGSTPILAFEMPLVARHRDIIIDGIPDSVLFERGLPKVVFEYKFTKSREPFADHHVQARTYGILLRNMGFDTNNLFYAIVMADPQAKDDKALKQRVIEAVVGKELEEGILDVENAIIHVNRFDHLEGENNLDWAIDFWTNKREPIPTGNPNKCKSCEYQPQCEARSIRS